MNKYIVVSLSVFAGMLSGLAWTDWCPGVVLLFSFIPLLLIEDHFYRNRLRYTANDFFVHLLPGMLIFNLIALGWTRAAGIIAAITIITGLTAVMSFVLWLAHLIRIKAGNSTAVIALLALWLSFEYLSLHTDFLSPWMNLGNGLSKEIRLIQWYEITGVGGGTLWILISNMLGAYLILKLHRRQRKKLPALCCWIVVIFLPVVISLTRYYTIETSPSGSAEVLIIQPNSDPYTEKYSIPFEVQLKKILLQAEEGITDSTSWIIAPETMIDDPVNEARILNDKYYLLLREFASRHPDSDILAGLVTYTEVRENNNNGTATAPNKPANEEIRQHFNSALRIDSGLHPEIYHKSKLVAGIEKEFSAAFGKLVNRVIPEYYGTGWGYGIQKQREVFRHHITGHKVGPVICYESVFGDFVADYAREGAEALFIITNDGWWKNTSGYKQHLNFASLRAIETRRPVARAANTGISCLVDIRGDRVDETGWWQETTLKGTIQYSATVTPYLKYGDFIFRISALTATIIILYVFLALPVRKNILSERRF